MSRCFTWFPIGGYRRTQCIPELGGFYKEVGRLWSCVWLWRISGGYLEIVCLCEELVGVTYRRWWGFVSLGFRKFKSRSSKNTPEML